MKKFSDLKQDFDDIELAEGEAVDRIKQRHARQREQLALKMKAELDRERERESDDVEKIKESDEFEHLNAQIDAAHAALDLFEAFDEGMGDKILKTVAKIGYKTAKLGAKVGWKATKVAAKAAKVGAKAVATGKMPQGYHDAKDKGTAARKKLIKGYHDAKANHKANYDKASAAATKLIKRGSGLTQRATKFAANRAKNVKTAAQNVARKVAASKVGKSVRQGAKNIAHDVKKDLGYKKRNLAGKYRSSTGRRVNEEFSDAFSSASFQKLLRHGLVEKSEIVRLNIALAKIDNGAFLNLIERELVFTILEKLILFISEDPIIFTRVNQGVIKNRTS